MRRATAVLSIAFALLLGTASMASAQDETTYTVTFANLTYNQIIGPPVLVSHSYKTRLFLRARPASPGVAAVAEDANAAILLDELAADPEVFDVVTAGGPLLPGQRVTMTVRTSSQYDRLSAIGMLVTTNDAFFGLSNLIVDPNRRVQRLRVPAYDSGTEANTESCEHIPGPPCGNPNVRVTEGAEGFVHIHRGFHGVGSLEASRYDWRNPVVAVSVVRN